MAADQEQPIFDRDGPTFEWSPGILITDQNNNIEPNEEHIENEVNENEIEEEIFDEVMEEIEYVEDIRKISEEESNSENEIFIDANDEDEDDNTDDDNDSSNEDDHVEDSSDSYSSIEEEEVNEETSHNVFPRENESFQVGGHNLRTRRAPNYDRYNDGHNFPAHDSDYAAQFSQQHSIIEQYMKTDEQVIMENNDKSINELITGFVFTQMSAKKGIHKHGKLAIQAIFNEFLQLHEKGVFLALSSNQLTRE